MMKYNLSSLVVLILLFSVNVRADVTFTQTTYLLNDYSFETSETGTPPSEPFTGRWFNLDSDNIENVPEGKIVAELQSGSSNIQCISANLYAEKSLRIQFLYSAYQVSESNFLTLSIGYCDVSDSTLVYSTPIAFIKTIEPDKIDTLFRYSDDMFNMPENTNSSPLICVQFESDGDGLVFVDDVLLVEENSIVYEVEDPSVELVTDPITYPADITDVIPQVWYEAIRTNYRFPPVDSYHVAAVSDITKCFIMEDLTGQTLRLQFFQLQDELGDTNYFSIYKDNELFVKYQYLTTTYTEFLQVDVQFTLPEWVLDPEDTSAHYYCFRINRMIDNFRISTLLVGDPCAEIECTDEVGDCLDTKCVNGKCVSTPQRALTMKIHVQ